jgi:DNA-binding NarL/FixJ family response regulator
VKIRWWTIGVVSSKPKFPKPPSRSIRLYLTKTLAIPLAARQFKPPGPSVSKLPILGAQMEISIDKLEQVVRFTPAEVRVIRYLLQGGLTNRQIARRISADYGSVCGHRTVQAQMTSILTKTEFANRTALALWAVEQPQLAASKPPELP